MGKVLAVDDSEPMRKMVGLVLGSAGFEVTLAQNGADALEKLRAEDFDLLVTDINMPVMHGIDLIQHARRLHEELPILALTTEGQEAMRKRGQDAGANGWVQKPFKPVQFLEVIRQLVSHT
ncbi:response regulator [Turneriella parva]|uniref:Response regulator receiver protein n=1 Tax=Turneriella parva (strain ATCC BAA-1111 / DSM 21527 / NCTC 11395 / H) TaxID=869212 RepID=I4BB32_TURPD|nr:response regulator [Turneriella parva]AFM14489.1 response regulator receiver protein [Turneriella parva DSM 21527]